MFADLTISGALYSILAGTAGAIAVVFFIFYRLFPGTAHNLHWAVSYLSLLVAAAIATIAVSGGDPALIALARAAFMGFLFFQVTGNFIYLRWNRGIEIGLLVVGSFAVLSLLNAAFHLVDGRAFTSLYFASIFLWNGLILRNDPYVGRWILAVCVARFVLLNLRPVVGDGEWLVPYWVASQFTLVLYAMLILLAAFMRNRHELELARSEVTELHTIASRQAADIEVLAENFHSERNAAQAANRAKNQFLANMSHEFRTPLNAVIGYVELMRLPDMKLTGEQQAEYLDLIHEAGQHQLRLVENILTVSAIDENALGGEGRREFSLPDAMDRICERHQEEMNRSQIRLEQSHETGATTVFWEEKMFERCFEFVFENAVAASPRGGLIALLSRAEQGDVIVTIDDEGEGVPEDYSIPDTPFAIGENVYRRTSGGLGVGLYLTQRLLELGGGNISIARRPDRGTRVVMTLRRAAPEQPLPV